MSARISLRPPRWAGRPSSGWILAGGGKWLNLRETHAGAKACAQACVFRKLAQVSGTFWARQAFFASFQLFSGFFFGTTTAALKQPEKSPGHLLHRQSAARAVLMQPMQRRTDDAKSALHRLHGPSCAAKSCRHSVLLRAGGRKSWLQASTRRLPPRNRPGIRCRAALPGRNLPCTRCMPVRTKASPPCNRCTADLRRKIQVARNEMSDRPQKKIACSGVMAKSPLQLFVAFVARKIPHEKIGRAFAARKIPQKKSAVHSLQRRLRGKKSTVHSLHGGLRWKKSTMQSMQGRFCGKNRPCIGGMVQETPIDRPATRGSGLNGVGMARGKASSPAESAKLRFGAERGRWNGKS